MRVIMRRCSTRHLGSPLHHQFWQHELGQEMYKGLGATTYRDAWRALQPAHPTHLGSDRRPYGAG
uniref:Uncharacterized protein n=1 Tax=Arundo donax TaxID=35708 RepID=A0A0A9FV53_ARUDO